MTATLPDIEKRLKILEAHALPDTNSEVWQLFKRLREERGLPPPDPADYGYGDDIREMFSYLREDGRHEHDDL